MLPNQKNRYPQQAEKLCLEIALEASLNPEKFSNLLASINHLLIKVNYDIGNSAALGYDPSEEMLTGKSVSMNEFA